MQNRKTKIVSTIGPTSKEASIIRELILAGANIFRFNLKHDTPPQHSLVIDRIRGIAQELEKPIEILIDLPGLSSQENINLVFEQKPAYVALSYIKEADEVKELQQILAEAKLATTLVGKIETTQALDNFEEILDEADAIMVARGDLGESIPIEKVPFVQKEILLACEEKKKKVIVATEMLLSMVYNQAPTRAEVSDVANAVLEGSHAVMLSEETAIGKYPEKVVQVMDRIIHEAESWKKLGHLEIPAGQDHRFNFGE